MKCNVNMLGESTSNGYHDPPAITGEGPVSLFDDNGNSSSNYFETLANLLLDPVYLTDKDGTVIFLNQAGIQTFFTSPPDLSKGFRPEALFAGEERKRLQYMVKSCIEGRPEEPAEYEALMKDGSTCPVMVQGKPIYTNGCCNGSIWVVTTLSRWKEFDAPSRSIKKTSSQDSREHPQADNGSPSPSVMERSRFGDIIGKSFPMQEVYEFILKAAANPANVIIYGESGTGKELVARAIHDMSDRKTKKFVTVNCGAIPENILESEFFGYKKGAFTGAHANKSGYLEYADGGTLFLDEVGEIGLSMQVKLLRAIEGGGYMPVGSNQLKNTNVRIIAATNRNPKEMVKKGLMREDFFYRIHILPIYLPALRERKEDLPLLVDHFIHMYCAHPKLIPGKIMEALVGYDWPGNVRELQNVLHRYLTLKKLDFMNPRKTDRGDVERHAKEHDSGTDIHSAKDSMERELIQKTLNRYHWHRGQAAEALKINRKTLFMKMKKYGLAKP